MACTVHTFPFPNQADREAVVIIYEVQGTKFATYHKHVRVEGGSKRLPDSFTEQDIKFLCECRDRVVDEIQADGVLVDRFACGSS